MIYQKKYIFIISIFSLLNALLGAFLIIKSGENIDKLNFSFFLYFIILLITDIIVVRKFIGNLYISIFSVTAVVSYIMILLGLIFTTKPILGNVLLLCFLLPVINIAFIKDIKDNFVVRSISAFFLYLISKLTGVFIFLIDLFKKSGEKNVNIDKKINKDIIKFIIVFLFTGLPLIIFVLLLLASANSEFSLFLESIFKDELSLSNIITRAIVFFFIFLLLIGEMYFVKSVIENNLVNFQKPIQRSRTIDKYIFIIAFMTITLLNLFYIIFILAELKYDAGNLQNLISQKGLTSFSALAVSRFNELLMVSFINLAIVYLLAKPYKIFEKARNWLSIIFKLNICLLFVNTIFMVYSVHQRLSLYESGYGYTNKRTLAHFFLPILLVIVILFFSSLFFKKIQEKLFMISFSLISIFFSLSIMLPTDYIINRMNIDQYKEGKIQVFDPMYTIPIYSTYYSKNSIKNNIKSNDVQSNDSLIIASEILKDDMFIYKLNSDEVKLLNSKISEYKSQYEKQSWREFNIMKVFIYNNL